LASPFDSSNRDHKLCGLMASYQVVQKGPTDRLVVLFTAIVNWPQVVPVDLQQVEGV
jgi:hypothetical protein